MNKNNVIFIIWHEIIQINPCMKLDTDTPLPFMTPAECPMLHKFSVKHTITVIKSRREQETCTIRQSKIVKTPFFTLSISIVSCLFISCNQQPRTITFLQKICTVFCTVQLMYSSSSTHCTELSGILPNQTLYGIHVEQKVSDCNISDCVLVKNMRLTVNLV